MVFWKRLLVDGQGTLKERLGLLVASLSPVELSQIIEGGAGVRMLRSLCLLLDSQSSQVEGLSLGIAGVLVIALNDRTKILD